MSVLKSFKYYSDFHKNIDYYEFYLNEIKDNEFLKNDLKEKKGIYTISFAPTERTFSNWNYLTLINKSDIQVIGTEQNWNTKMRVTASKWEDGIEEFELSDDFKNYVADRDYDFESLIAEISVKLMPPLYIGYSENCKVRISDHAESIRQLASMRDETFEDWINYQFKFRKNEEISDPEEDVDESWSPETSIINFASNLSHYLSQVSKIKDLNDPSGLKPSETDFYIRLFVFKEQNISKKEIKMMEKSLINLINPISNKQK